MVLRNNTSTYSYLIYIYLILHSYQEEDLPEEISRRKVRKNETF